MDYWEECILEAFEDAGISATQEQIDTVTSWVESSHDHYGMAHGHDCIPNPMIREVEETKRTMADQQEQHDRRIHGICRGVARRRNVNVSDVHVSDGGSVSIHG
jgi:hypothetical protein